MFKAWPKIPRLENEVYYITEQNTVYLGVKENDFLEDVYDEDFNRWRRKIGEKAYVYKKKLASECQIEKRAPNWYEGFLLDLAKFDINLYSKIYD